MDTPPQPPPPPQPPVYPPPPLYQYQPRAQPSQLHNPMTELFKTAKAMLWSAGFLSYLVVILFSFVIILAMTPWIQHWIVTPYPGGGDPSVMLYNEDIFLITPFYLHLFYMGGIEFQVWHIAILSILFAGFAQAIYGLGKKWQSRPNKTISFTDPDKADSSLEAVAKLFMASLSFSVMYFIILSFINVEMKTPAFDTLSTPHLAYELFSASVFEELISRVLLIGVPLVFLGLALKWKKPHRMVLGGGLDITPATMVLITISAFIFALAHAGGWDYWKVPQVLIPGFALGWAFVRYGLHASMLIHFSMNCTDVATEIWPDNLALQAVLGIVMLIWIIAGAYFLLDYSKKLRNKLAPKPAPQQPQYQPSAQYYYVPPPQPGYVQPAPIYYPPPGYIQQLYYPPPPQRFCLGCGLQIQPDYNHCPHCGKRVQPLPAASHPAPYSQPTYQPPPQPSPFHQGGFVCPACGHTGATYEPGKLICLRCGQTFQRDKTPASAPQKEQVEF